MNLDFSYVYKFNLTLIVLALVDLLWLTTGGPYALRIAQNIQGGVPIQMNYGYAVVVYFFLAYLLLQTKSYSETFLFGVCIYGVYDFTTLAIFKKYDVRFALADTLWGGMLFVISRYFLMNLAAILQIKS